MIGRNLKYIVTVRQADGDYKYVIREGESKEHVHGAAIREFGIFNVGRVLCFSTYNIELISAKHIAPLENFTPVSKHFGGAV